MIPIIRWELLRRRTFTLWWCLGVAALVAVLLLVYPSIRDQAKSLNQVISQLPESVRALRGGDADLTTPAGYLNAEVFYITLPLLFIILAVNLGGSILAKDEQDRTLELLLARPIRRGALLAAKALSAFIIITIVGVASTAVTLLLAKVINMDIAIGNVLLASVGTVIFAASFGAIAFALTAASVISRRAGLAIAVVGSFGGYILESLSSLSDFIKTPAKLLPYHYFIPQHLLMGQLDKGYIFYMLGIFAACALIAYLGFRRRDIG